MRRNHTKDGLTVNELMGKIEEKLAIHKKREKDIEDLTSLNGDLAEEISGLKFQYLLLTKLLSKIRWTIDPSLSFSATTLKVHPEDNHKKDHPEINLLFKWYETNWHCHCELEEGTLSFDDRQISMRFEDPEKLITFCRKHEIIVDTSSIEQEIKSLTEYIDSYQARVDACRIMQAVFTEIK
jgi:hypothetical protein